MYYVCRYLAIGSVGSYVHKVRACVHTCTNTSTEITFARMIATYIIATEPQAQQWKWFPLVQARRLRAGQAFAVYGCSSDSLKLSPPGQSPM